MKRRDVSVREDKVLTENQKSIKSFELKKAEQIDDIFVKFNTFMNLILRISNDDKKLNYVDEMEIVYLPEIYVRTLREMLIKLYHQSDDPIHSGYTAPGNLSYAMENVRNVYNKYKNRETRIISKAAFILYHLVFGHPFADGNKRTGIITTNSFLEYNGYSISTLPFRESKEFLIHIARGQKSERDCREFIKKHISKLEISERLVQKIKEGIL